MADEDFDIDVYDDGDQRDQEEATQSATQSNDQYDGQGYEDPGSGSHTEHEHEDTAGVSQPPQQGVKRKGPDEFDERPIDPGATTALMVSEMNWWNNDEDIRQYTVRAGCEKELRGVTFSEHKVNGKSKGYVVAADHVSLPSLY
jgi:hypothetical protein